MKLLNNDIVISRAKAAGFDLAGFAPYTVLDTEGEHLTEWLKRGYHSGMKYMERNFDKRIDIRNVFPEAKSIISLALNYYTEEEYDNKPSSGKISRYAWGKDYHLVMWDMLENFISGLKDIDPSFEAISYVDTGPVMDKAWAVKAGLGWMGKHTNIINKENGSWFFIATVITNYEFTASEIIADHCGSCTACVTACPTGAIEQDYLVNANKCISYLTIENKGDIPEEFSGMFDNWIFGCDICQDVCPWNNKFAALTNINEFYPTDVKELNLDEIEEMTDDEFNNRFTNSPLKRTKLKGLKRNASFLKKGTNSFG